MSENQQPRNDDGPAPEPWVPQEQPLPDYYAEPAAAEPAQAGSSPLEAAPDPRLADAFAEVSDGDQPAYEPEVVSAEGPTPWHREVDQPQPEPEAAPAEPVAAQSEPAHRAPDVDIPVLAPASPEPARPPLGTSAGAPTTQVSAVPAVPAVASTQVITPEPVAAASSPATTEAVLPSRRQARLAHQVAATGPSLWEHLVGILLGVVLAALGLLTIGLGAARISELNVDGTQVDNLGIVFVCLGAIIVAAVLSLGLWTAAVPFTAGIITTAAGGLLLFAPQVGANVINDLLRNNSNAVTIDWLIADGNAGWYFILGILLLVSGIVNSTLKRRVRRVAKMLLAE